MFEPCFVGTVPLSVNEEGAFYPLLTLHKGAAGYALNQAAARLLIDMIFFRPTRADILPFSPKLLKGSIMVEQLIPAIVVQKRFLDGEQLDEDLVSSLGPERAQKALETKLNSVRRMIGLLVRLTIAVKYAAVGRRIVVPFKEKSGRLIRFGASN